MVMVTETNSLKDVESPGESTTGLNSVVIVSRLFIWWVF